MGIQAETQEEVRKETATKIFGQPTANDLTQLEKELIAIAAAIPTSLGGGNHGHARIIVDNVKYLTMTKGIQFITPINPGAYQTNIAGTQQMQYAHVKKQCTKPLLESMKSTAELNKL